MQNVFSKGILAAALIAGPAIAWGEVPAASPTTQAPNQDDGELPRGVAAEALRQLAAQADRATTQAAGEDAETGLRRVSAADLLALEAQDAAAARRASLDAAREQRARAAAELGELRKRVQDQTGLVEVTPETVRQIISRLQEQREALELDGAGAMGRRQALQEAVGSLSKKLEDRAQTDLVVQALEKVVDVRKAQLQRVQESYKQAVVPRSEVEAAEASLAQAQAEVAAAQQKAAGGAAGDPLDAWNRQLLELGIADGERDARLKFISKRLEQFSEALRSVDQMEELRARLAAAEGDVAASEANLRQSDNLKLRWELAPHEPAKP